MTETADQNLWNRDYVRYGAGLSVFDLPIKGLVFTVRGESWQVTETVNGLKNGRGNDTQQASGEVSYRYSENLQVAAGSSHHVYDYDYNLNQIREDVRVYFAEVRLRGWGHRLRINYSYEHDDFEDFQVLRVGYRYEF